MVRFYNRMRWDTHKVSGTITSADTLNTAIKSSAKKGVYCSALLQSELDSNLKRHLHFLVADIALLISVMFGLFEWMDLDSIFIKLSICVFLIK